MKCKFVYKVYANDSEHSFQLNESDEKWSEVILIDYHYSEWDGDAHYCDVHFESDSTIRIFKPDVIEFV